MFLMYWDNHIICGLLNSVISLYIIVVACALCYIISVELFKTLFKEHL